MSEVTLCAVHSVLASACELLLLVDSIPVQAGRPGLATYLVKPRHPGIAAFCGTAGRQPAVATRR